MSLYQFLNAESSAVLQTETRRCIYLDQPATIHTENYIKWRDGWTEIIPASREITTPYSSTEVPAWIEKVGDAFIEHPATVVEVQEVAVDIPESMVNHPPHTPEPYVAPPVVPTPVPTPEQLISELEAQFTQRRLRELLLTGDKTFLQTLDAQITAERGKIKPKTP